MPIMARRPQTLSEYPWVTVRISCRLCSRRGRYRLVRLAAIYGPEMQLLRLLADLAADCPWWNERSRQNDPRCGAHFIDLEHNLPPADEPAPRQRLTPREDVAAPESPPLAVLSQWPASRLVVLCDVCVLRNVHDVVDLRAATPGDVPLSELLRSLTLRCAQRRTSASEDRCGARLAPE